MLDKPQIKERMQEILGKEAGTFSAALVQLTKQNEALSKCDPATVIGAALTAAALRLPIDPNLGQAYVVPYGKDAQFQLGYRGLIQLAQRSGEIKKFIDVAIPQGGLKSWNPLTEELDVDFDILTNDEPGERGDPDGYAVFLETASGFTKTVFWTHKKAMAHGKRFSKAFHSKSSPWQSDPIPMCLKTVIIATLKRYAPLSIELQRNIAKDQGVVDVSGEVRSYPDNPANEGSNIPKADFEDMKAAEEAEASEKKDGDKKEKSDADAKKDALGTIEGELLNHEMSEASFLKFLKQKNLIAQGNKEFKDAPTSKLVSIAENISKLISEYAAG